MVLNPLPTPTPPSPKPATAGDGSSTPPPPTLTQKNTPSKPIGSGNTPASTPTGTVPTQVFPTPPKPGQPITPPPLPPKQTPPPQIAGVNKPGVTTSTTTKTVTTATSTSAAPQPKSGPVIASASGGPVALLKKWWPMLAAVVAVIAVVGIAFAALSKPESTSVSTTDTGTKSGTTDTKKTTRDKQVTLTYWGLWEPKEVMEPILKEYEQANPGVLISYVKQNPQDYRERLQSAVASGQGPDVFRFHASWVPMLKGELAPMPTSVFTPSEYQSTFYPIVSQQLQSGGQLVGVPVMYDGLVLYYNEDILAAAGAQPPKTWSELRTLASKLTLRSGDKIQRGGVAIGNAGNVEHFSDILGLLILQNGGNPAEPSSKEVQEALTFYTNFYKVDKVWSEELPSSTAAFARGDVAMMLAPSWRAHDVRALNPALKFGTVKPPMLSSQEITWGTYWAEGVNAKGQNKDESWKLLKFLSSAETEKKMFAEQSKIRQFGEPFARKDLTQQSSNPVVATVLSTGATATNWYLNAFTFDSGLNDQIIRYYRDGVNAMITSNRTADQVVPTISTGVKQVLRQYGVVSGTTTGSSSAPTAK